MAATANPSAARSENLNSPQTRRSRGWTQIVRGEPESAAAAAATAGPSSPSSPHVGAPTPPGGDCSLPARAPDSPAVSPGFAADNNRDAESLEDAGGNAGKKQAWSKPSNGAVEVSLVMGAVSWPALSESAKPNNAKPQSDYSSSTKGPEEGSSVVPTSSQGSGVASSSHGPPQKQVVSNANPNPTPTNTYSGRHRGSSKRGGGAGSAANNGSSQFPAAPVAGVEPLTANHRSPRDHALKSGNWDSGQRESQSHTGSNHHQQHQRNSFRRGNGRSHPRGDGSYHNTYGGRRDRNTDRVGNHDWNPHQYYNGRDSHMHPQRAFTRPFVRPPSHTSTFVPSPPVRPFSNPMGFELPSPLVYLPHEPFRGVPFIAPIPHQAVLFPALDPQLHATIVTQIDYYFSNENLIKDTYLRQNMDDQGWVPIKLIAGFNKVKNLTDNIQLISDALRTSSLVEVQGDKVRRRNDWMRWVMPSVYFPTVSGSQSPGGPSHEILASKVQSVVLSSLADVPAEALINKPTSGDFQGGSANIVPPEI